MAILGGAAGGFFARAGVKMVISLYKKRGGRAEIHSESILQRSAASCDAFASSAFLLSLSLLLALAALAAQLVSLQHCCRIRSK